MASILWLGNVVGDDGFGRIGNELLKRLQLRGHQVGAAGIFTQHVPWNWPYQVWALAGHDWGGEFQQLVAGLKPDAIIVCQDWPYLHGAANAPRVDYSRHALLGITPTDGAPIDTDWIAACARFDALFTISRFGVETFRRQGGRDRWGHPVGLLIPGVDRNEFRPASPEERAILRQQAGIAPDAYVLGAWMANQGRKCWPEVLELFARFRQDVPGAVLIADTERHSPAGWRLDVLAGQIAEYRHLPPFKDAILFRETLQAKGVLKLRDRVVLADVALQLAYREGYGLPITEAQSCGVLVLAQDYCSGTELCDSGRGLLCHTTEPGRFGTWGNALEKDPNLDHALSLLLDAYHHPGKAAAIRETAIAAVKSETWDAAADVLEDGLRAALERRAAETARYQRPAIVAKAGGASAPSPVLPRFGPLTLTALESAAGGALPDTSSDGRAPQAAMDKAAVSRDGRG